MTPLENDKIEFFVNIRCKIQHTKINQQKAKNKELCRIYS